jgi:hypothetical protein
MMTPSKTLPRHSLAALALCVGLAVLSALSTASARTITLSLEFDRLQYSSIDPTYLGSTYYTVNVLVSSDTQPVTYDEVDSPGASPAYVGTESGNGRQLYGDIGTALYYATNGAWKLTVNKGDPSQQQYTFAVSVNGLTGNLFPAVTISSPVDGNISVATNTAFTWSGPGAWSELDLADHSLDYTFYTSVSLSPSVTTWSNAPTLPLGTNEFEITCKTSASSWVAISTPLNSQSQPFTNWVAGAKLVEFVQSGFVTTTNPAFLAGTGHTLFAHYTFTNNANTFQLGLDSSPANNSMSSYSWWGPVHTSTTNAVVGGSAVQFFGASCMTPGSQVLSNFDNLLAGSFTFSAWVNTTAAVGNKSDVAVNGATIFWAYNDHSNTNDAIPLAITGSKAAFSVRDHLGNSTTLHSTTSVNDGRYHLITVTRNQLDGVMDLYVDGALQAGAVGPTDPLNGNNYFLSIGGTSMSSYTGLLDDMQVYSGVLSPGEVAQLFNNPGVTISDTTPQPAHGLVAHYDFDEGAVVAPDVSGNSNNIVLAGYFSSGNGPVISSNAIEGPGSVSFDGGSFLTAPGNLLASLAGDFSLSLWVNTTQNFDYPGDSAYNGAGVISAYFPNVLTNDLVPVALTGGYVAFDTRDPQSGNDDTLTSSVSVNDGNWHHIVVSRNQASGEKDIYVDGVLNVSDTATTASLNAPQLLTIGAISDASNPDPSSPATNGYNGYQGLLDDIQIYNRVLGSNEVVFLFANPGATIGAQPIPPLSYPVDISLQFDFIRSQDPDLGQYFTAAVAFNFVNPAPVTSNCIYSPHNCFIFEQYPSGEFDYYGYSTIFSSLGGVLNECTNGSWSICINQGSSKQQVYTFQMSAIAGLTSNLLKAVAITLPTNWQVNVPTNPAYDWTGPSNFSALQVSLLTSPATSLPATATNWPSAPAPGYGTNCFQVEYTSNNFPGVTFTTPVATPANSLASWATAVNLTSEARNYFVVGAPAPLPVLLTNAARTAGNFEFSFQTLAGRSHTVQSRTNLAAGSWVTVTNFTGDGSLRQLIFPTTNIPARFFRVETR